MVTERALDDLLAEIRRFKVMTGASAREFARICGLQDSTLRGMDDPEWSPTVSTLRAILRAMDGPTARFFLAVQDLRRLSLGVVPFTGRDGGCLEHLFRPEAARAFGKDALADALDRLCPVGMTGDRAIGVAKDLVPAAAVHLVDVSASDPEGYLILHWDTGTDYRGGVDFTGVRLLDVEDDAYRQQLGVAYREARESGRPRVSFLHRRGVGGVRSFYRALIPLPGPGNVAQVVAVVLPQEPEAARYLLPHRFRG